MSVLASAITSKAVTCLIPPSIFDRVSRLIFHPSNPRRAVNSSCDKGAVFRASFLNAFPDNVLHGAVIVFLSGAILAPLAEQK